MFRSSTKATKAAVACVPRAGFAAAARVPSIKFTHGKRDAIAAQIAAQAKVVPPHFATFSSNGAAAGGPLTLTETVGKTVTVGGKTTTTIFMPSNFIGDPFGRPRMAFDDATIALIQQGGVYDPPAPPKKAGGKK